MEKATKRTYAPKLTVPLDFDEAMKLAVQVKPKRQEPKSRARSRKGRQKPASR